MSHLAWMTALYATSGIASVTLFFVWIVRSCMFQEQNPNTTSRSTLFCGPIERTCVVCGCTEDDCSDCMRRTGQPCYWVGEDLCSACSRIEVIR